MIRRKFAFKGEHFFVYHMREAQGDCGQVGLKEYRPPEKSGGRQLGWFNPRPFGQPPLERVDWQM
jgi:hypothetical protein